MTKLEIILAVIIAGLLAYIYFTWKPAEIVVGPSQQELDDFKAKADKSRDSLLLAVDSLKNEKRADSLKRAQQNRQTNKVIKNLTDRANSLLAQLNDSTPCCEASEIKTAVIALKDSVLEKKDERIQTDSLYIQDIESNFARRIANEKQQRELLEQETKLQSGVIEDQKRQIRKHKREKVFIGIAGVVLVVLLL